jgi:hypothetical protein
MTSLADKLCWHSLLTLFADIFLLTFFADIIFCQRFVRDFFWILSALNFYWRCGVFWTQSFFQKTWSFLGGHGRFHVGTWSLSRQWWPLLTIIATRPTSLPGRSEDLWGFSNWSYLGETEEKQLQYKGRKRTSFSHNEWINISYHTINPVGTPM